MNNSLTIAKVKGININLHISWLLVLAVLSYVLSTGFYPLRYDFNEITNWILGVSSALLLFVSVFIHELAHSLIAQKKGIRVKSITLFFFGGLANIETDPEKPLIEFKISIGGPLASIGLGIFFYILYIADFGVYFTPVFDYLSKINFMLAIFNLIPAFPLDGGRVFRAILWAHLNDLKRATRIASNSGKVFGAILIAFGILLFPSGLWFIFIGMFLMFLAESGYKQVLMKLALDNVNIKDLIIERPLIDADMKIDEFTQWCKENKVSEGIIKKDGNYYIADLNNIPAIKKKNISSIPAINTIMTQTTTVSSDRDPFKVLRVMQNNRTSIIPVIENNKYIGIITIDYIYRLVKIINIQEGLSEISN